MKKTSISSKPIQKTSSTQIKENSKATYINAQNLTLRTDKKYISDKEVPRLIESDKQKAIKSLQEYKDGKHNFLSENKFTNEEKIFFNRVYAIFQNFGLNPNFIKLTKLNTGTFNVDYVPVGYIGKIRIIKSAVKYRVIKQGAKRASRVCDSLSEANHFINNRPEYRIEPTNEEFSYYIQYVDLENVYNFDCSSLQELLNMIPKWANCVKYLQRK